MSTPAQSRAYTVDPLNQRVQPDAPRGARTIDDACQFLGIGRTALYALIAAGRLDARKLGKRTLVLEASLRTLLTSLPRLSSSRFAVA